MAGRSSTVHIKKEATYADTFPASGMYKIPFTSEGFDLLLETLEGQNITGSRAPSALYANGKKGVGTIAGQAVYTRLDHLIHGILGSVSTVDGTAGDAGAFTNTHVPGTGVLPSFAVQVSKGNIPASKVFQWYGMKVKALEFNWADRGPLNVSAELVGKDEISGTGGEDPASSDVTLVEDPISVGSQMTTVDLGTGADDAYCLKTGRIRIEQALTEDDYCAGSDTPQEPDFDGFIRVTFEGTYKFTDRLIYNDMDARTDVALLFAWTSPNLVVGGGSLYRKLDIRIPKAQYTQALPLIDTPGMVLARIRAVAYGTAGSAMTTQPIAIQTVNEVDAADVL